MCEIMSEELREEIAWLTGCILSCITPELAIRILALIIEQKGKPLDSFDFSEKHGIVWLFRKSREACMREGVSWEIAQLTKKPNYVISLANFLGARDARKKSIKLYRHCHTIQ